MIAVCLATYNGEKYLAEQLDSLLSQSYDKFDVFIRDDGSSDSTLKIVEEYQKDHENIKLISDNKESSSAKENFSIILEYVYNLDRYSYFMFCDQDDVWLSDKIERSMGKMRELELNCINKPLLVHTDLEVVDKELNVLDNSFWNYERVDPKLNSLNRLIVQNTVTGCTVLINKELLEQSLPIPKEGIMHDWWIAMVASVFGHIGIVREATVKYRQHNNNNTGAFNFGIYYILNRMFKLKLATKYIKQANSFFETYKTRLDEKTIQVLKRFIEIEKSFRIKRIYTLIKYKILKQGLVRNLGFLLRV